MKKQVESFFAEKVKGKVELRSVSYNRTHDHEGRGYISVDGVEVWNMCTLRYYSLEAERTISNMEAGASNIGEAQKHAIDELDKTGKYDQWAFYQYLKEYCSLPIEEWLGSEIPLIRSLAMIDGRVGKRTLKKMDTSVDHEMVAYFYRLRCELEGVGKHTRQVAEADGGLPSVFQRAGR